MATTFHQFSDLPTELRMIIWNLALDVPRDVNVHHEEKRIRRPRLVGMLSTNNSVSTQYSLGLRLVGQLPIYSTRFREERNHTIHSTTPCPALLFTNWESRLLSQRFYRRLFRETREVSSGTTWYIRRLYIQGSIYVSPEIDTICCNQSVMFNFIMGDCTNIIMLKILDPGWTSNFFEIVRQCLNLRILDLRVPEAHSREFHLSRIAALTRGINHLIFRESQFHSKPKKPITIALYNEKEGRKIVAK